MKLFGGLVSAGQMLVLLDSNLVGHDGRHGTTNFMVLLSLSVRPQKNEQESEGNSITLLLVC